MKVFNYVKVEIKLKELMEDQNISINKLSQASQMQRYQLKKYMNNKVQRIDLQVLARLCYVLECSVEDILEYKE